MGATQSVAPHCAVAVGPASRRPPKHDPQALSLLADLPLELLNLVLVCLDAVTVCRLERCGRWFYAWSRAVSPPAPLSCPWVVLSGGRFSTRDDALPDVLPDGNKALRSACERAMELRRLRRRLARCRMADASGGWWPRRELLVVDGHLADALPLRVVIVGLDFAGKTTLLYQLRVGPVATSIPFIGFTLEEVALRGRVVLTAWDVDGGTCTRPMWKWYYNDAIGLVFVVDAADVERLERARCELHLLVDAAPSRPLLVLANKCDRPGALGAVMLSERLELHALDGRVRWHAEACSTETGEGLEAGMVWLHEAIRATFFA